MNSSSIPSSGSINRESHSILLRHRPRPGTRVYPGGTGASKNSKSTLMPLYEFAFSRSQFPAPATTAADTATSPNPEAPASTAAAAVAASSDAHSRQKAKLESALAYLLAQNEYLKFSSDNVTDGDRRRRLNSSVLRPSFFILDSRVSQRGQLLTRHRWSPFSEESCFGSAAMPQAIRAARDITQNFLKKISSDGSEPHNRTPIDQKGSISR